MIAERGNLVDDVHDVAREVAGVAGGEAHPPNPGYLTHRCQ